MKYFNSLCVERGGICKQKKRLRFIVLLYKYILGIYLCIIRPCIMQNNSLPIPIFHFWQWPTLKRFRRLHKSLETLLIAQHHIPREMSGSDCSALMHGLKTSIILASTLAKMVKLYRTVLFTLVNHTISSTMGCIQKFFLFIGILTFYCYARCQKCSLL